MVKHGILVCSLALAACRNDSAPPRVHFQLADDVCTMPIGCVDRDVHSSKIGGVTLIHKRSAGEPLVSARVFFDGGAARWTPRIAIAESMLLTTVQWFGSEAYRDPGGAWDAELGRLGAQFSARSGDDFASISISAPAVHFEDAWRMLQAAVLEPPLYYPREAGLDHLKSVYRSGYDTAEDEPEGAASLEAWKLISAGHPYNLRVDHVDEVASITIDDLVTAQKEMLRKSRMAVVVVGDVDRARVEHMVDSSFGKLPSGGGRPIAPLPPLVAGEPLVTILDYPDSPTWHVRGYFPAPPPSDPDYPALMLGLAALSDRLFDEVRTRRALVYQISMGLSDYRANYGFLALSSVKPAEALQAVRALIDELTSGGIDEATLEGARAEYLTGFLSANQTANQLSWTLANWQLTSGDRKLVDAHLARVAEVTAAEAQAALATYLPNLRYAAAGAGSSLSEGAFIAASPSADGSM